MKIRKRKVNSQDHTLGYLVGPKWMTRKQAVALARKGKVEGVTVVGKGKDEHLRSKFHAPSLYSLPTQMV